ncbi:VWA domain-containing protein, partial [Candidatus Woesearchaeota archaeon]|nr:VWA domain-containing protein [Candidatus Woesearchaeota archaeon]
TIKVVPKPKVALWTAASNSPIEQLLRQVYDVTSTSSLPLDLEPYYAVVTNDVISTAMTDDDITRLSDYVQDGNGLVAVGGQASYDKGGYQHSYFETLLPVVVGTPGKEEGDVNIVLLLDASMSVSSDEGGGIKSSRNLALSVLDQMSPEVKVGITAFRNIAYDVVPISYKYELVGVEDKLAAMYGAGSSKMHLGILRSIDMLKNTHGSKNIIVISDGILFPNDQQAARDAALLARKSGIKIYTVGVAVGNAAFVAERTDEDLMKGLAALSGGIYFRADATSKFNLLFGDVKKPEKEPQAEPQWAVSVLDSSHFITEGLETNATIYGFNAVAPKTTGRTLVVTSSGEPIITTWNLGLGRVAAYSTDDGSSWAGQLLSSGNSKLLIRMMNWVNGDPDRKRSDFVDVKDTRINEATELTIKAAKQPTASGLAFYKIRPETYQAEVVPKETGFHSILGATYAANYPAEYGPLGVSKELELLVGQTGGKFFASSEADQMVEFAKSHVVKDVRAKDYFRWHLAVIAASLFLVEIFLRRMMRR